MSPALLIVLVLFAGVLTGLQPATNAMLSRAFGLPIAAALVSFAVGTVVLVGAVLALGVRPQWTMVRALPWYAFAGGLYGALFVSVAAFATPRLGVGLTLVTLVAGQLLIATVIDSFGLFGLARHTLTPARAAGLLLVVAGVALARRG